MKPHAVSSVRVYSLKQSRKTYGGTTGGMMQCKSWVVVILVGGRTCAEGKEGAARKRKKKNYSQHGHVELDKRTNSGWFRPKTGIGFAKKNDFHQTLMPGWNQCSCHSQQRDRSECDERGYGLFDLGRGSHCKKKRGVL